MPLSHEERTARRKAMADDLASGMGIGEVAKKYGVSTWTVRRACDENSVQIPRKPCQRLQALSIKRIVTAVKLLTEGHAQQTVADYLGVTKQYINQVAKAMKEVDDERH